MMGDGFGLWDSVEIHGDWNIPGLDKVSGTLFYTPSTGLILKLKNLLNLVEHEYSKGHWKTINIVQGIDIHEEHYSLHNVQLGGPSVERRGERPGLYQYHAESVFIGKKYKSEDELDFASIKLCMEGLEYWFGHKFKTLLHDGNYKIEPKGSDMFPIPELSAKVHIGGTVNMKGCGTKVLNIEQQAYLQLSTATMQKMPWYDLQMYHLYHLMTLLIGSPTYLTRVQFDDVPLDKERRFETYIQYVRMQSEKPKIDEFNYCHSLIPFPAIESSFGFIVNQWFVKRQIVEIPANLMIGALAGRTGYLENTFISLMAALECFVQRAFGDEVGEYDVNRRPKRQKMKEHPLGHQIFHALSKLSTDSHLIVTKDIRKFSDRITSLRNQITHPREEKTTYTIDELNMQVERVKAVLFLLLLKEVGVDESLIRGQLNASYSYAHLRHYPF